MGLFDLFKKNTSKKVELKEEINEVQNSKEEVKTVSASPEQDPEPKKQSKADVYEAKNKDDFLVLSETFGIQPKTKKNEKKDYGFFHDGTLKENLELADLVLEKGYDPFFDILPNIENVPCPFALMVRELNLESIEYLFKKGLLNNKKAIKESMKYLKIQKKGDSYNNGFASLVRIIKLLYDNQLIDFYSDAADDSILRHPLFRDQGMDFCDIRLVAQTYSFVSEKEKDQIKRSCFRYPISEKMSIEERNKFDDFMLRDEFEINDIDNRQSKFIDKLLTDFYSQDIENPISYTKENPYSFNEEIAFMNEFTYGNTDIYVEFGDSCKYVIVLDDCFAMDFFSKKKSKITELYQVNNEHSGFRKSNNIHIDYFHSYYPGELLYDYKTKNDAKTKTFVYHEGSSDHNYFYDSKYFVCLPGSKMSGKRFCKAIYFSKDAKCDSEHGLGYQPSDIYTDASCEEDREAFGSIRKHSYWDDSKFHFNTSLEEFCSIFKLDYKKINGNDEPIKNIECDNVAVDDSQSDYEKFMKTLDETIAFFENIAKGEQVLEDKNIQNKVNSEPSDINVKTVMEYTPVELRKEDIEINPEDFEICDGKLIKYKGNESIVRIPDGVKSIGYNAFEGKEVEVLYLPEGMEIIPYPSWRPIKKLKKLIFSSTIKHVEASACECLKNLTDLILNEGLLDMGDYAFAECSSLERVVIPSTVTYIGSWAFKGCKALKEIVIPSTLEFVDSNAFISCSSLEKVTVESENTLISWKAFDRCNSIRKVYIPENGFHINGKVFSNTSPYLKKLNEFLNEEWNERINHIPADRKIVSAWKEIDSEAELLMRENNTMEKPKAGEALIAKYGAIIDEIIKKYKNHEPETTFDDLIKNNVLYKENEFSVNGYINKTYSMTPSKYFESIGALKCANGSKKFVKGQFKTGDTISFGSYVQRKNGKKEPIEWLVLEEKDDYLLVLSKYSIADKPFKWSYRDSDGKLKYKTLLSWLNNEFANDAFSAEENAMLKVKSKKTVFLAEGGEDIKFILSGKGLMDVERDKDDEVGICLESGSKPYKKDCFSLKEILCLNKEEAESLSEISIEEFNGYSVSDWSWWTNFEGLNPDCTTCVCADYIDMYGEKNEYSHMVRPLIKILLESES